MEALYTMSSEGQLKACVHRETKEHVCPTCSAEFATKTRLKRHRRREEEEARFKCDVCGAELKQSVDLQVHMHIHSDERVQKCDKTYRKTPWSLCVLVPLMGVSWILGIFYVNESASFMQYVFAVCNGLQGVNIFVFNCILNGEVRNGFKAERIRRRNKSMASFSH
ncbi:hypothetical protein DPMN_051639, partial [Dreissena polymorpha]